MFRLMAVRMQFIRCLARRGNEPRWRESLAISSFALIALGPWTFCRRPISYSVKSEDSFKVMKEQNFNESYHQNLKGANFKGFRFPIQNLPGMIDHRDILKNS